MAVLNVEDGSAIADTGAQRLRTALPLWLPGLQSPSPSSAGKPQTSSTKYTPLPPQQSACSCSQQCCSHPDPHPHQHPSNGCTCSSCSRTAAAARCRPHLGWLVTAFFLTCPLLATWVIPGSSIGQGAMLAALCGTGYAILALPRWEGEAPHVRRFLLWFVAMVVELLFENCMVWLVAASDVHKYEDPPGLQDNLELAATWLGRRSRLLAWLLHVEWATTAHFLAAVLALVAGVAWEQHPYSGLGVMARFCATITTTRLLRTFAFTTTVLPSPRPGCYRSRFPAVPDTAWGVLRVGVGQLRGSGGCNDLVFSGHGSFWTMAPLVYGAYYPGRPGLRALLWGVLVQASVRNVLLHNHYSLDHFLAPLVTAAVWTWLGWVYPVTAVTPVTAAGDDQGGEGGKDLEAGQQQQQRDKQLLWLRGVATAGVVVGLVTAGVVIFVAKA